MVQNRHRRAWLIVIAVGCAMVTLAMVTVALVIADKQHFGWLVNWMFVPVITSGVMVGSVVVLIGAWNLAERNRWQGRTFIAWGIIGLTSPAFGLMFLLPWGVLALLLPAVITALVTLFKREIPVPSSFSLREKVPQSGG